jgi:hypothetical protein
MLRRSTLLAIPPWTCTALARTGIDPSPSLQVSFRSPPFLLLRRRTTRLTRPPVGRYSEAELAQAGADAVLSDLSDLRHVLACLGLDDAPAG